MPTVIESPQEFIERHSKEGPPIEVARGIKSDLLFPTGALLSGTDMGPQMNEPPAEQVALLKAKLRYFGAWKNVAAADFKALKAAAMGTGNRWTWPERVYGPPPDRTGNAELALMQLKEIHDRHAARERELQAELANTPAEVERRRVAERQAERDSLTRARDNARLQAISGIVLEGPPSVSAASVQEVDHE